MIKPTLTLRDKAEQYHRCLPDYIAQYLKRCGIPATIIDAKLLGWNNDRITIPVFGLDNEVLSFRYGIVRDDLSGRPEVVSEDGAEAELYGWETIARAPNRIIVCEGEIDRLVLEAHSFKAVASTGGANAFLPEWAEEVLKSDQIYVCFHRSPESNGAAKKVQELIPKARIAHLPDAVGTDGSIADFVVALKRTVTDFEAVLAGADGGEEDSEEPPRIQRFVPKQKKLQRRAEQLREEVRLYEVVSELTTLQASGHNLIGNCPLHDDRAQSFMVYLENDTYRCSVCGAQGDALTFLMDKESMTFSQALDALEGFAFTHELYGTF